MSDPMDNEFVCFILGDDFLGRVSRYLAVIFNVNLSPDDAKANFEARRIVSATRLALLDEAERVLSQRRPEAR